MNVIAQQAPAPAPTAVGSVSSTDESWMAAAPRTGLTAHDGRAAINQNGIIDYISVTLAILFYSLPNFVMGFADTTSELNRPRMVSKFSVLAPILQPRRCASKSISTRNA